MNLEMIRSCIREGAGGFEESDSKEGCRGRGSALHRLAGFLPVYYAVVNILELLDREQAFSLDGGVLDLLDHGLALLLRSVRTDLFQVLCHRVHAAALASTISIGGWPTREGTNGPSSKGCCSRQRRTQAATIPDSTFSNLSPTILGSPESPSAKVRDQFGQAIKLLRLDPDIDPIHGQQGQNHVLHGAVPGPLPDPRHRRVGHASSRRQRHQGVRHPQAEIVVEMGLQRLLDPLANFFNK